MAAPNPPPPSSDSPLSAAELTSILKYRLKHQHVPLVVRVFGPRSRSDWELFDAKYDPYPQSIYWNKQMYWPCDLMWIEHDSILRRGRISIINLADPMSPLRADLHEQMAEFMQQDISGGIPRLRRGVSNAKDMAVVRADPTFYALDDPFLSPDESK